MSSKSKRGEEATQVRDNLSRPPNRSVHPVIRGSRESIITRAFDRLLRRPGGRQPQEAEASELDHLPYSQLVLRVAFLHNVWRHFRKTPDLFAHGWRLIGATLTFPQYSRDPQTVYQSVHLFAALLRRAVPAGKPVRSSDRDTRHRPKPSVWFMADFSKGKNIHFHGLALVPPEITDEEAGALWTMILGSSPEATTIKRVRWTPSAPSARERNWLEFRRQLGKCGFYYSRGGRTAVIPFFLRVVATGVFKKVWVRTTGRRPTKRQWTPLSPPEVAWEYLLGTPPRRRTKKKKCEWCGEAIPSNAHGNRRYCGPDCQELSTQATTEKRRLQAST